MYALISEFVTLFDGLELGDPVTFRVEDKIRSVFLEVPMHNQ